MGPRTRRRVVVYPPSVVYAAGHDVGLTILKARIMAGRYLGGAVYTMEGCGLSRFCRVHGRPWCESYNFEGPHHGWVEFGRGRIRDGGLRFIPLLLCTRRSWCGSYDSEGSHYGWVGFWCGRVPAEGSGFYPPSTVYATGHGVGLTTLKDRTMAGWDCVHDGGLRFIPFRCVCSLLWYRYYNLEGPYHGWVGFGWGAGWLVSAFFSLLLLFFCVGVDGWVGGMDGMDGV